MYRRIMVGTDGSEYSDKAVDHALELCRATGAELLAVSVVNMEVLECIENSDRDVYCKVQDSLEQRANDILSGVEEKAARENVPVKKIIQVGDPAEVLVELAKREGADLIVVGTRGHVGVKRVTLGSHAQKVVRWSNVPVLVVR
ncbi:MAG: universal stress protein [Candidatus Freyrarchaeum guaymaensis]